MLRKGQVGAGCVWGGGGGRLLHPVGANIGVFNELSLREGSLKKTVFDLWANRGGGSDHWWHDRH